jgi:hypothetical protein
MSHTFFHAVDPMDGIFCHNIKITAGRLHAMSYVRDAIPSMVGCTSMYEAFNVEQEKEEVFETIRIHEFSNAPPRKGAIFLFATKEDANAANVEWWHSQRVILQAEVVEARRAGAFDARQLNSARNNWEAAARTYWSKQMSTQPKIEILVDGVVQLKGWEIFAKLL